MYTLRVFWPNNGYKHFIAGPRNIETKNNNKGIISDGSSDGLATATVLFDALPPTTHS